MNLPVPSENKGRYAALGADLYCSDGTTWKFVGCIDVNMIEGVVQRLNSVGPLIALSRAARVYFREFDHLIGSTDYPERRGLRELLYVGKEDERRKPPELRGSKR